MIDISTPSIKWVLPKTLFNSTIYFRYKVQGSSLQTRQANISTNIIGSGYTYVIPAGWNGTLSAYPTLAGNVGNLTRLITTWMQSHNAALILASARVYTDHLGRFTISADMALSTAGAVELVELSVLNSWTGYRLGFPEATPWYLTAEANSTVWKTYETCTPHQVYGAWYPGCAAMIDTWDHEQWLYSEHRMRSGRVSRVAKAGTSSVSRHVKFDMVHAARIYKSRLRSSMVSSAGIVPDPPYGTGTLEHLADKLIGDASGSGLPLALVGKVFLDGEFDSTRPTSGGEGGCHHLKGPYDITMSSFDPGLDRQHVQDMAVEFYPVEFEFNKTGYYG